MSWGVWLGFILSGTLWVSWTWVIISFPILGKFSTSISSKYFIMVFLFVFFWDSYYLNIVAFNTVLEVCEIVLISFNSFFFFPLFLCIDSPRHILIKLTKIKHKEQILKAAREKQQITHKGIPTTITADLSIETLQARREWQDIK